MDIISDTKMLTNWPTLQPTHSDDGELDIPKPDHSRLHCAVWPALCTGRTSDALIILICCAYWGLDIYFLEILSMHDSFVLYSCFISSGCFVNILSLLAACSLLVWCLLTQMMETAQTVCMFCTKWSLIKSIVQKWWISCQESTFPLSGVSQQDV